MQTDDARQLREEWARKGNPPCDHPDLDKEHGLGTGTGDYVCTNCGQTGHDSDWPQRERAANEKKRT